MKWEVVLHMLVVLTIDVSPGSLLKGERHEIEMDVFSYFFAGFYNFHRFVFKESIIKLSRN